MNGEESATALPTAGTADDATRRTWSAPRAGPPLTLLGLVVAGVAVNGSDVQAVPPSVHFTAAGDFPQRSTPAAC